MMQDSSLQRREAMSGTGAFHCWALGWILLGLAGVEGTAAERRVALLDFRCEDVSYRSWEAAKELTALLQAVLPARDGIEWLERKEMARVESELELGRLGLVSPSEAVRVGQVLGAEWGVQGSISTNDAGRRTLRVELTDLTRAERLRETNLVFEVAPRSRLEASAQLATRAAALVDGLLAGAQQPPPKGPRPYRIAWVPQPDEALNERVRNAILSTTALTSQGPVQLLDFNRAGRSIEEADLGLLGLAESRSNAWRQLADVYVWPVGVRPPNLAFPFPRVSAGPVVFRVCDGLNSPRSVTNAAPFADLTQLISEGRTQARLASSPAPEAEVWRHQIVAETLPAWLGPIENYRVDLADASQREPWLRKLAVLELIAFLDPTNATAREALIRLRWSDSSVEQSRSPFLNRYRSSQAWEQHVARFGLQNRIPIREPHDRVAYHFLGSGRAALSHSTRGDGADGFPSDLPAPVLEKWRATQARALFRRLELAATDPEIGPWIQPTLEHILLEESLPAAERKKLSEAWQARARPLPSLAASPQPTQVPAPTSASAALHSAPSPRLPLPRVSALISPEVHAWLDEGVVDGGVPVVNLPPARFVQFPAAASYRGADQLIAVGEDLWLIGSFVIEAPVPSQELASDLDLRQARMDQKCLWRLDPRTFRAIRWTQGLDPCWPVQVAVIEDKLWVGVMDPPAPRSGAGRGFGPPGRAEARRTQLGGLVLDPATGAAERLTNTVPNPVSQFAWFGGMRHALGDTPTVQEELNGPWVPAGGRTRLPAGWGSKWLVTSGDQALVNLAGGVLYSLRGRETKPVPQRTPPVLPPVADGKGGFFVADGGRLEHWNESLTSEWVDEWRSPLAVGPRVQALMPSPSPWRQLEPETTGAEMGAMSERLARRAANLPPPGRRPSPVRVMTVDAEWLWLALSADFRQPGPRETWVMLMHWPSRRWVASGHFPGWIEHMVVRSNSLWCAGTYDGPTGGTGVWRWPLAPWRSIPESKWVALERSEVEARQAEKTLRPRQRAIRALWRGDPTAAMEMWGPQSAEELDAEALFLMVLASGTPNQAKPEAHQRYERVLLQEYPTSLGATAIRRQRLHEAVAVEPTPMSTDRPARAAILLARYDMDQSGTLHAEEIGLIFELEPAQMRTDRLARRSSPAEAGSTAVLRLKGQPQATLTQKDLESLLAVPGEPAAPNPPFNPRP